MARPDARVRARRRALEVGLIATMTLASLALAAPPVAAKELTVKLPASVQLDWKPLPGPNDPERCVVWAFARFPHIRLALGYEVGVDDTSQFDLDAIYSGPPFPDDEYSDYPAVFKVPDGFHQFALSGLSSGAGCASGIASLDGRWKIDFAHVSMKRKFSDRYKRPFDRCQRRKAAPKRLEKPIVLGRSLEPLMVERSSPKGKVFVTREDTPLNWEQQLKREWTGANIGSALVRTNATATARITDGAGNGILVGPNMTIRIEAGKPYEVVKQGSKSFGSLGVAPLTSDVPSGCVIATQ